MVVSMIQLILEIPDAVSLKEKRSVLKPIKDKLQQRFKISIAEVDLHDSITFSQIGAAIVSNSRAYGESVMQKILNFIEDDVPVRIQDVKITSEIF